MEHNYIFLSCIVQIIVFIAEASVLCTFGMEHGHLRFDAQLRHVEALAVRHLVLRHELKGLSC